MENKMRCVITGLGMINSIGNSVDESWNNCINGVSGIKEVKSIDTTECYAHLGAEAAEHFDVDAGSDADKMDRVSLLCVKAAKEALSDSKCRQSRCNHRKLCRRCNKYPEFLHSL